MAKLVKAVRMALNLRPGGSCSQTAGWRWQSYIDF